jgi:sec-independent protein translocase protein TatA
MGSFSLWHWLVVGIIVLLLFGRGRFSDMMGDVAKGIKSFKKGMSEEEESAAAAPPRRLTEEKTLEPVERTPTPEPDARREP